MQTQQSIVYAFKEQDALIEVQSEAELAAQLTALVKDEKLRQSWGEKAWQVLESQKGVAVRTVDLLAG